MRKLFIGVLFITLNFNINIGNATIGLIPSFIGYALIVLGLRELVRESKRFRRPIFYAQVLMVYSTVTYLLDLFGVSHALWLLGALLGLISTLASLYMMYCIILGIKDMEKSQYRNLGGEELYIRWRLYVIFSVVTYLIALIPILNLAVMILTLIFSIWFLFCFNTTKNLYYEETI